MCQLFFMLPWQPQILSSSRQKATLFWHNSLFLSVFYIKLQKSISFYIPRVFCLDSVLFSIFHSNYHFLSQLNLSPTPNSTNVAYPGNILDLFLTNNEPFAKEVTVHPYPFDSDHHPVTFDLNIKAKRPNNVQRRVYSCKKLILFIYLFIYLYTLFI